MYSDNLEDGNEDKKNDKERFSNVITDVSDIQLISRNDYVINIEDPKIL